MQNAKPASIDEYIAGFPEEVQKALEQVRSTIKGIAPQADETIKYAIPTFTLNGNLIHFAAFKNHIGLYPAPTTIKEFEEDFSAYKSGKGSVQFPLSEPMPLALIEKVVQFRVEQQLHKKKKPG